MERQTTITIIHPSDSSSRSHSFSEEEGISSRSHEYTSSHDTEEQAWSEDLDDDIDPDDSASASAEFQPPPRQPRGAHRNASRHHTRPPHRPGFPYRAAPNPPPMSIEPDDYGYGGRRGFGQQQGADYGAPPPGPPY